MSVVSLVLAEYNFKGLRISEKAKTNPSIKYREQPDFWRAINLFESVLHLDEFNKRPDIYRYLMACYLQIGNDETARAYGKTLAEMYPNINAQPMPVRPIHDIRPKKEPPKEPEVPEDPDKPE